MKLNKALKLKNKYVKEISDLKSKLSCNSYQNGNKKYYSTEEVLVELYEKKQFLSLLKSKIQIANGPILEKIYMMAELKDLISSLKNMDIREGSSDNSYSHVNTIVYIAQLNQLQVAERIKEHERRIEVFQEEIDTFNHRKEIVFKATFKISKKK